MFRPGRRRRIPRTALIVAVAAATAAVVLPTLGGTGGDHASAAVAPTGTQLSVSGVKASGDDGTNEAEQAVDGDLGTRWSGPGDGAWIRLDTGTGSTVRSVQIAWYHGDERVTEFEVQTSTDGTTWRTVHSGRSSGETLGYETYDVADSTGRYVRIVGHGNTVNDWTSINEVRIYGSAAAGRDPNGVEQIYPTDSTGAKPWVLGYNDADGLSWWDRAVQLRGKWLDGDNVDVDITGSGKDTVVTAGGTQVRLYAAATNFDPDNYCDGDTDLEQVLSDGYMCSPKDWTNYEITGYFQLVTPDSGDDRSWQMYGGGGNHPRDSAERCKGTAYKARLHYEEGWVQLRKEGPHPEYSNRTFDGRRAPNYIENKDKWLGMKLVRYQTTVDGEPVVRLEMYLDTRGVDGNGNPYNDWVKVASTDDAGHWGNDLDLCGVRYDQIMFWGGPWAGFRWDHTTSRIRLMSVREIVPPRA